MSPPPVSPSPFPLDPGPIPGLSGLAYMAGVLLLVCVAAYFTIRFLHSRGLTGRLGIRGRLIRVLERYPLAAQRHLLIVEVAGKIFLLGMTEQAITFLTPLDSEALAKDAAWIDENQNQSVGFTPFNSYLSALSRRWRKDKKEPPDE